MIRANTRGRLTAADLQLVLLLLSRGSAHRRAYLERRLETEGPDPLLGAPDAGALRSAVSLCRSPPLAPASRRGRSRAGRLSGGAAARLRTAGPRLADRLARRPSTPLPGGHRGRSRVEQRRTPVPRDDAL